MVFVSLDTSTPSISTCRNTRTDILDVQTPSMQSNKPHFGDISSSSIRALHGNLKLELYDIIIQALYSARRSIVEPTVDRACSKGMTRQADENECDLLFYLSHFEVIPRLAFPIRLLIAARREAPRSALPPPLLLSLPIPKS